MLQCPQCEGSVEEGAERCSHCPAVFTKPEGFRPIPDSVPRRGNVLISVGIWLLMAPWILVGRVFLFPLGWIAFGCTLILLVGLANRFSRRRSVQIVSVAFGCLATIGAALSIAAIAVIMLAMIASK